ncbi:hypothetical protein ACIQBJ_09885 [Kitasatospora sp. NPDC088391]|uniref:hypothetical protein n=1 Tax=Kitasatospora sp. NPDC088391 TaxID=3364074 RepID=UPI0037F22009
MSGGFNAEPERLAAAAEKAHRHAEQIESHTRNLDGRTRGRSLGKGKFGALVERSVRPVIDSMIKDMGKAMAKGHRSLGQGLEITRKNIMDADQGVRDAMRSKSDSLNKHNVHLKPGQSVPDRKGLRQLYHRRIDERVGELQLQGHGVGRHLKVTDQQLKDRLGTPFQESYKEVLPRELDANGYPKKRVRVTRTRWSRDRYGYPNGQDKIDPLRGPDARTKYQPPDLFHDVEKKDEHGNPANHTCDRFSTAFTDPESFVYAEQHARGRLDPNKRERQVIEFHPHEAWGPGGHTGRFKGYFVDPDNPMSNGQVNYHDVDFRGARIKAVYDYDSSKGGFVLHTMFPEPNMGRNLHGHSPRGRH